MNSKANEVIFKKGIPNTDVEYGFTYNEEPVILVDGSRVKLNNSLESYVMCLLNIEDWERESTLREKYEMNLLIAEKIGLSKVITAVKFFSSHNETIEGKMELVMVESIPSDRRQLSRKCNKIREKYANLDNVI